MRLSNYTLSPTRTNNAKAKDKLYKLSDCGGRLVEVSPAGQKTWRYRYLPRQAVELLTLLKALGSESQAYVFPS